MVYELLLKRHGKVIGHNPNYFIFLIAMGNILGSPAENPECCGILGLALVPLSIVELVKWRRK